LYISALNEVIDRHAERVTVGLAIRVPPTVLLGVYVVALFAMFLVGVQTGYGERRNYLALVVLVLILSVVFLLIVDLDRSQEGLLRVNQQAMIDLQRQLNAPQ
jgi:positive regulator of sigma E activity